MNPCEWLGGFGKNVTLGIEAVKKKFRIKILLNNTPICPRHFLPTFSLITVFILFITSCTTPIVISENNSIHSIESGNLIQNNLSIYTEEPPPIISGEPQMLMPAKIRSIDGMEMIFILSTSRIVSENNLDDQSGNDTHPDHFWIDKDEVTNQQYSNCVGLGNCTEPKFRNSHTRKSYYGNEEFANYPVIFVNWNQARLYCESIGGRLPTLEEWKEASGGNVPGRTYPWGNEYPNSNLANYAGREGDTSEVGSYTMGASPYGVMDMAGNVWEWLDSKTGKKPDCCGLTPGAQYQVLRGGAWSVDSIYLENTHQISDHFLSVSDDTGFRCVVDTVP